MKNIKSIIVAMGLMFLLVGCTQKTDKFEISSKDYTFIMETQTSDETSLVSVKKIVEKGKEYSSEDLKFTEDKINNDGIDTLYEAMFFSVVNDKDATIKLNGKDYKEIRKEKYADLLNVKTCSLDSETSNAIMTIEHENGTIKKQEIRYEIIGDYASFVDVDGIENILKDALLQDLSKEFNREFKSDDVILSVSHDKLTITLNAKDENNDDMIITIRSLENTGYRCN